MTQVCPLAPRWAMTSASVRRWDVGRDGAAPLGEQGPHFTDRTRNGGVVHAEPAGQDVVRRCMAEVHERCQQAVKKTSLCLALAPMAQRGRDVNTAWCRSRHSGPSSAITAGVSPAIRWLGMIAVRAQSSTTRIVINEQGLDGLSPTRHELVRLPRGCCGWWGKWVTGSGVISHTLEWKRGGEVRVMRDCW